MDRRLLSIIFAFDMSYSCQCGCEEPTVLFLGWQIDGAIKTDNNGDKISKNGIPALTSPGQTIKYITSSVE